MFSQFIVQPEIPPIPPGPMPSFNKGEILLPSEPGIDLVNVERMSGSGGAFVFANTGALVWENFGGGGHPTETFEGWLLGHPGPSEAEKYQVRAFVWEVNGSVEFWGWPNQVAYRYPDGIWHSATTRYALVNNPIGGTGFAILGLQVRRVADAEILAYCRAKIAVT